LIHLLDINLLLALAWPTHEHHSKAMSWLRSKQQAGFLEIATCPLTELGFLRISMGAMNVDFESASRWLEMLAGRKEFQTHFWSDDINPQAHFRSHPSIRISGHKQLTDFYLAELALRNQGRLATLDGGMDHPATERIFQM
jgi:uncharacterized protein